MVMIIVMVTKMMSIIFNVGYDDGDDGNTFLENFSNTPTSLIIIIMAMVLA